MAARRQGLVGWAAMACVGAASALEGTGAGAIPDGLAPSIYGAPLDISFAVDGMDRAPERIEVVLRLEHPRIGDLRARLIDPAGDTHLLFARTLATSGPNARGSSTVWPASAAVTFTDRATVNWWQAAGFSGTLTSETVRTVVSGGPGVPNPPAVTSLHESFPVVRNGTWILRIDDGWSGDQGMVISANLNFSLTEVKQSNDVADGVCNETHCSLREAIAAAPAGERLTFAANFTLRSTIEINAPLQIDKPIEIVGWANQQLRISARRSGGLFVASRPLKLENLELIESIGSAIDTTSDLDLTSVTIRGSSAERGAAIRSTNGVVKITNSALIDNRATIRGGAIEINQPSGQGEIRNTTFSGNVAPLGAAIYIDGNALGLGLIGSTVAFNRAARNGAAIEVDSSKPIALQNSIVAANQGRDLRGNVYSAGHNLIGVAPVNVFNQPGDLSGSKGAPLDPKLAALNRSPLAVPSHGLMADSPALDRGFGTGTDARNQPRPFDIPSVNGAATGNQADIGAAEMQARIVSITADSGVGSLRTALDGSGFRDVLFDPSMLLQPTEITLQTSLPITTFSLQGPGAARLMIARDAAAASFGLMIASGSGGGVALSGVSLSNRLPSSAPNAGVIECFGSNVWLANVVVSGSAGANGAIKLDSCNTEILGATFVGNRASQGGAIHVFAPNRGNRVRIARSTFSDNAASFGGAIHVTRLNSATGLIELESLTFKSNQTGAGRGAVLEIGSHSSAFEPTQITLRNLLLVDHPPQEISSAVSGQLAEVRSLGFNLSNSPTTGVFTASTDRPATPITVGPLQINGGPTPTHALIFGTPAIDSGDASGATTDQTGRPRTDDFAQITNTSDGSDIGAFEYQDRIFADALGDD